MSGLAGTVETMTAAQTVPPLGPMPLTHAVVDRGCEVRTRPGWLGQVWQSPQTGVLWLHGGRAPLLDGRLVLLRPGGELPSEAVYLGRVAPEAERPGGTGAPEGQDVVMVPFPEQPDLHALPDDAWLGSRAQPGPASPGPASPGTGSGHWADRVQWIGLREAAAALTAQEAALLVEAVAIAHWHRTHTHCPRCGTPTQITASGWVRTCPQDGSEHFPRTDPAVIVAITDPQDRILLGSNAAWSSNRYSTLAGFVEPGESLEAAVVREVEEESGLTVHSPRYLGSQPWPFPQSLMLGFHAVTDHPEPARADQEEMRSVRWFSRDELRQAAEAGEIILPGTVSIARALIEHWYGSALPEPRVLEN